jgi:hypothetical protein
MWQLYYTKQAQKDARKLASSGLKNKAQELLAIICRWLPKTEHSWRIPHGIAIEAGEQADQFIA